MLAYCPDSGLANVELARAVAPAEHLRARPLEEMREVATPGKIACEDVAAFLNVPLEKTVKAIAVVNDANVFHLLLLRGDHNLNEVKTNKIEGLATFRFATEPKSKPRSAAVPAISARSASRA